MKLFWAQIEEYWKDPVPYEYGEVSDEVMGRILVMDVKQKMNGKPYTMQSLIDSLTQADPVEVAALKKEWTNEFRKPKDVLFCGTCRLPQYGAVCLRWDYTYEWKARDQKRRDKALHKAVSDYEKRLKKDKKQ